MVVMMRSGLPGLLFSPQNASAGLACCLKGNHYSLNVTLLLVM